MSEDDNIHTLRDPHPDFDPDNPMPDEPMPGEVAAGAGQAAPLDDDDVPLSALGTSRFDAADDVEEFDHAPAAATGGARAWPLPKLLVVAAAVGIFGYVAYSTLLGGGTTATGSHPAAHMARMGRPLTSAPTSPANPPPAGTVPTGSPEKRAPATSRMIQPAPTSSPAIPDDAYGSIAPSAPAPAASASLVAKVTDLTSQVTQLQAQVTALKAQVAVERALKAKVETQHPRTTARPRRHVAAASPKKNQPKHARKTSAATGGPELKAVLVGQAWFQLKSGTTITVGVGDTVPKYGKVTAIDANAGTVQFASGDVAQ